MKKIIWSNIDNNYEDDNEALEEIINKIKNQERTEGEKYYLVIGKLGLWNGVFEGGKVIKGMTNVIRMAFEDYNCLFFENKQLKITAIHHDGCNYFTVFELSSRGKKYYFDHQYDNRKELCEALTDSHYRRMPKNIFD